MPPTTNPTHLLVKKELHVRLDLESMLVMFSPTNFLMMTPGKSVRFCQSQQEIGTRWMGELQDPQTHCLCQV